MDYGGPLPFVKVYKDYPKVYNISAHVSGAASIADVYRSMPKTYRNVYKSMPKVPKVLRLSEQQIADKKAMYERNTQRNQMILGSYLGGTN